MVHNMETRAQFQRRKRKILESINEAVLEYNESEFWIVQSTYEYIEYYATKYQLLNTAVALELARGLHNGVYRKSPYIRNGVKYKLPYLIHPLSVTRMLMELHIPMSREEEDILLAAALCHDMIEDVPFENGGKELYTKFKLDKRVYDTVLLVSKRKDFTPEQEQEHFNMIQANELALLVKLSDRGNNVEDLYNRSVKKVHEYIEETNKYFIPMCQYALNNYYERERTFELLQDKIVGLTEAAEILVDRYSEQELELQKQVDALREENEKLRAEWKALWEE